MSRRNYSNITYSLSEQNGKTVFTVTQDNFKTTELVEHSEKNWGIVFNTIKEMLGKSLKLKAESLKLVRPSFELSALNFPLSLPRFVLWNWKKSAGR
ncbi:MAG: SRPBCC domain-containing protein [Bacteroidota bacterium]